MSSKEALRVVYGVCGIGLGHSLRQLPIVENYHNAGSTICIFAYGNSYNFFRDRFAASDRVTVQEVAVPFYAGKETGLDFAATANHQLNSGKSFLETNCYALDAASREIGKPDLVITDYEPTAAQYAYSYDAPLVTIDQQSKYLVHENWPELAGLNCRDEVMRLRMLFPKAVSRIATSFFRVLDQSRNDIEVHGPVLRDEVLAIDPTKYEKNRVLVYLSSQQVTSQAIGNILDVLGTFQGTRFDVYLPALTQSIEQMPSDNISIRAHGAPEFLESLSDCEGVISTAGHTLLSEAMYLAKPVLAIPLSVYEQQMNADVIAANGFGMKTSVLERTSIAEYLEGLEGFRERILADKDILIREPGQRTILRSLGVWNRPIAMDIPRDRDIAIEP